MRKDMIVKHLLSREPGKALLGVEVFASTSPARPTFSEILMAATRFCSIRLGAFTAALAKTMDLSQTFDVSTGLLGPRYI